MHLILLIFYIAINLSQGQIINHFPPNNEDHVDKLRWPSLHIIMHVPTNNGTLKRVPVYTSHTEFRRYMDWKSNRRFYNNDIKNTQNDTTPVATETEWAMGRPPGVQFQSAPGVNYANFHPGQNSPPLFNNINIAKAHFNAQRKNKTSFMNVDVAMQPDTNHYYLKRISPDNITTVLYNNTENTGNRGTVTRKMYSNQGYQRTNGPVGVDSGTVKDVQNIVNDVLTNTTNNKNNRNLNKANQYEPSYKRLPQYRDHKPYSAYSPAFRPTSYYQQNVRKPQQTDTPPIFTENINKLFQSTNLNKNQNSGIQKQNVPFFWDGKSPMNISITQRDPHNQTLFSYSFDPIQLLPKNITKSFSDHRVHTRKRNRVKEASIGRPQYAGSNQNEGRAQNGPQKISLNTNVPRYSHIGHPLIEYDLKTDESSEFLGFFPKNTPRLEDKNDFLALYSNLAEETFSKPNEDVVETTAVQHDPQNNDNTMLIVTPIKPNLEEPGNTTGQFIVMQLKKPPGKSSSEPTDFKSKVEPLIITSIYRQFLSDLKRNLSSTGTAKQKLHFSFKLGPGYFNTELMKPNNMSVQDTSHSDDEHYDSIKYQ